MSLGLLTRFGMTRAAAAAGGSAFLYHRLLITATNGGTLVGTRNLRLLQLDGTHIATGGTATASQFNVSYPPASAFDGSGTGWRTATAFAASDWLQYQTGAANEIVVYGVGDSPDGDQTRAANAWTLQGSNNGSTWTDLASETGQTGWSANETRFFTVDAAPAGSGYRFYRLNVSANNGDTSWTAIADIELRETVAGANVATHAATGLASTSTGASASFPVTRAFDDNPATYVLLNKAASMVAQFEFFIPRTIAQYAIVDSIRDANEAPNSWTFEGSNDGSSWTVLDTVTGESGWVNGETRAFTL